MFKLIRKDYKYAALNTYLHITIQATAAKIMWDGNAQINDYDVQEILNVLYTMQLLFDRLADRFLL